MSANQFPDRLYVEVRNLGKGSFGEVFQLALDHSKVSQRVIDDFVWPMHVAVKKLKKLVTLVKPHCLNLE